MGGKGKGWEFGVLKIACLLTFILFLHARDINCDFALFFLSLSLLFRVVLVVLPRILSA